MKCWLLLLSLGWAFAAPLCAPLCAPVAPALAASTPALATPGPDLATAGPTGAEDRALALLHEAAQRSAQLRTLYARFTQEKKLSILDAPLSSSGYMCLERPVEEAEEADEAGDAKSPKSAGSAKKAGRERVLWVYEKPTPSGFAQEDGQAWLWTGHNAARRKAQGAEAAALKAITAQILAWVHIQPQVLQGLYTMQRVDVAPAAEPVLRLKPKQTGAFFAALEVTLAPDLATVRQLRFEEKNGDSTLLRFHDTLVNAPLPAVCAPSQAPSQARP